MTEEISAPARHPLRPALLAAYRDLTTLRYDYPLVLVADAGPTAAVQSLTGIVNRALRDVAPRGAAGERLRRHALKLEQEIRRRVAAGETGRLSAVWDAAAAALVLANGSEFSESIDTVRAALKVDGEVLDCDHDTPARVVRHVRRAVENEKRATLVARIDAVSSKLAEILAGSPPAPRAARIRTALAGLTSPPGDLDALEFTDAGAARAAFVRERDALVVLVRALTVAELEAEGAYEPAVHDHRIASLTAASLTAEHFALVPSILLRAGETDRADVLDILAAGLPIKILFECTDVLGLASAPGGLRDVGPLRAPGARIAAMAAGLDDVFVLQASAAALVGTAGKLARGLAYAGPALIATHAPVAGADTLPTYLASAAVMQARMFPTFCYDPSAGPDLARRWSVATDNPQHGEDWSSQPFVYESRGQRVLEEIAFTPADLLACDPRAADDVCLLAASAWTGTMVPVDEWLKGPPAEGGALPYVSVVDADDRLHRAVVGPALLAACTRWLAAWAHLREVGGIGNSWAETRLAAEKETWDEERAELIAAAKKAVGA